MELLIEQENMIEQFLNEKNGLKIIVDIIGVFRKKATDDLTKQHIKSRRHEIVSAEDIPYVMFQMATDIEFQIEKMELSESGLVLIEIEQIRINYDKYHPTRGGSFIELPKWIQDKKVCINIQNEDNKRFKYCIQCGVCKIYENTSVG